MFRRVFLATSTAIAMFSATAAFADGHSKDIVKTATDAGSFGTLVAAVQEAGLVDTVMSAGPFAVFAATEDAFAALPAGTVKKLSKPENEDKLSHPRNRRGYPAQVSQLSTINSVPAYGSERFGATRIE